MSTRKQRFAKELPPIAAAREAESARARSRPAAREVRSERPVIGSEPGRMYSVAVNMGGGLYDEVVARPAGEEKQKISPVGVRKGGPGGIYRVQLLQQPARDLRRPVQGSQQRVRHLSHQLWHLAQRCAVPAVLLVMGVTMMRAAGASVTIPTFATEPIVYPSSGLGESAGFPFGIASGDYDGDQFYDLVVVNSPVTLEGCHVEVGTEASVTVFHNLGTDEGEWLGFATIDLSICEDCAPAEVALVDMNGDGLPDIVVSASDGDPDYEDPNHNETGSWGIYISFQDESHDFEPFNQIIGPEDMDTPPRGLAVFEIDGDNGLDVAVAGDACRDELGDEDFPANDKVYVYLNNGSGNLARYDTEDLGIDEHDGSLTFAAAYDLSPGQLNISPPSQGKIDLVTCNLSGDSFSLLTNLGNGSFSHGTTYGVGCADWSFGDVVTGQFNSSGIDFAAVNQTGAELRVFYGSGLGGFTHACHPRTDNPPGDVYDLTEPGGCTASAGVAGIAVGQLNGDIPVDLVVTQPDCSDVVILLGIPAVGGTSAGKFQFDRTDGRYRLPVNPSGGGGKTPMRVIIEDVTGDGLKDIVTTNFDSHDISILVHE